MFIILKKNKNQTIDKYIWKFWSCSLRPLLDYNNRSEYVRMQLEQQGPDCSFLRSLYSSGDEQSMRTDRHDLE